MLRVGSSSRNINFNIKRSQKHQRNILIDLDLDNYSQSSHNSQHNIFLTSSDDRSLSPSDDNF